MVVDRSTYLKNIWSPYPKIVEGAGDHWGRIVAMDNDGLELRYDFHISMHSTLGYSLFEGIPYQSVLKVNDLVQILPDKKILLLSPHHSDQIFPEEKSLLIKKWDDFLSKTRIFFKEKSFLEIQTPSLVICPGTEPTLDVFSTLWQKGSLKQKMYLPTSPEIHLKKSLVKGYEKIFEIKNCFRNNELSQNHQPEFMMLEWYRTYAHLPRIQQDLIDLISYLTKSSLSYKVKTMAQLFYEVLGFRLTPQTQIDELRELIISDQQDSWDDVFYRIFLEKIEPLLGREALFVTNYPPSQAALARVNPQGWADRFEFYWQGLEIANAFDELNDPVEQRKRSQLDLEQKKHLQKELIPLDEDFYRHLEYGMPPSAGVALGLERLFMAIHSVENVAKLKLFPYE